MDAQVMQSYPRPDLVGASAIPMDRHRTYKFGLFTARPSSRYLARDGKPIDVGSRAFDLLVILLRSQGDIVSKDEIFRYVWPSTTVDESNLRFQMATLRKALGAERDRIKTIPGRGYLFVADESYAELNAASAQFRAFPKSDQPAIVIIDRDPENRAALHQLLKPFHALVQSFGSMEAFLQSAIPSHD